MHNFTYHTLKRHSVPTVPFNPRLGFSANSSLHSGGEPLIGYSVQLTQMNHSPALRSRTLSQILYIGFSFLIGTGRVPRPLADVQVTFAEC